LQRKTILLLTLILALALWAMPAWGAYTFEQLPSGKFSVTFTYPSAASEVYLVGEFNDWNTSHPDYRMEKNAEGVYEITIELAKGAYEYKFFADGQWKADPENPDVVPGFGNSLATITAGSIVGELAIKGEMNNELIKAGKGAIAFNNDLTLKIEGTLQEVKDQEKTDRFDYMAEIRVENDVKDVEHAFSPQDYHIPDNIYLNKFNATLLQKYANISLQGNMTDDTNSFDYLKIVDAQTSKDDRDNFNINDFGDSIRIKITPGSDTPADWNYHFNFTKYTSDITKASSTKKYYSSLNLKKDFKHGVTGEKVGEVGVAGLVYQPVVLGKPKDTAVSGGIFGSYELFNNFTVRAEYAHLPTGDISESVTGAYDYDDQYWKFIFNAYEYPDIEKKKPISQIEKVHIVGEFGEISGDTWWKPERKDYTMKKVEDEDGVWELLVPKTDIAKDGEFKFIFDADSWDAGHECGQNGQVGGGANLKIGQTAQDIPIKPDGQAYMAEVNYRIFDPRRSFRVGGEAYKFDVVLGYKALSDKTYLPVAADYLYKLRNTGFHRYYLSSYLYPLNNDLKLTLDGYYLTYYKEAKKSGYGANLGFDFPAPVSFLEYIKGNVERHDITKADGWIFEKDHGKIIKAKNVREYNQVFFEGKTKPLGWVNYFKGNVQYTNKIEKKDHIKLFAETELLFPVEQIAYLKGNIDYILGDPEMPEGKERDPRFWVEGKVHHLPYIQDYITHILVNYEYDKGGIKDKDWYGDDDNDWEHRIYGETKFILPQLDGFELTVAAESRKIEEGKYDAKQAFDKDSQYYVAAERAFIDWYTFLRFTTGYEFSWGLRADLTVKFDLNHKEISKYEDDAIKFVLTQPLSDYSTLTATYNSRHPDHSSKETISLNLKTLF